MTGRCQCRCGRQAPVAELATDFGVSRDTIRFIATRKFWREATEDLV